MDIHLSFALFYTAFLCSRLSIDVRGAAANVETDFLRNESLAVLFLDSTDPSYHSSTPALRNWIEETLRAASDSGNYHLQLISIDTKCDQQVALSGYLDLVQAHPVEWSFSGGSEWDEARLVAILGGGCVTDSEIIIDAIAAGNWNTSVISYSPFLYPLSPPALPGDGVYHFQVYPSLRGVVTALVATIQQYGWTQMSIISEFNYPFLQIELDVVTALNLENITVFQPSHFQRQQNTLDMPYLFAEQARIFFLNMYENKAAEILCRAYQEERYYPDYVWLLYGWYSNNWWTRTLTSCNSTELLTVLERTIILQSYPNFVADDLSDAYRYPYIPPLLEDSVQLLVRAMNVSAQQCSEITSSPNETLVDSCSDIAGFGSLVGRALSEASFEGKSGRVEFDAKGTRAYSQVALFQFRDGTDDNCFAAVHLDSGNFSYKENEDDATVWPDGVPQDGSPIDVVLTFSLALVILNYSFSFLGITFALICLGFNIIFRKRKLVKLTSPNLNYFIILGALFLYAGAIARVTPSKSLEVWVHFCRVLTPFLCIGYSLCFGAIMIKMWRIYYIFHNPTTRKKEVKDWHLVMLVSVILAIDLVIVAAGFIFPDSRPMPFLVRDGEHHPEVNEKGITENYFVISCHTTYSIYWRMCIYLYMGILQAFALVLAVRTRKVKIKGLNDSKEIQAIIYLVTLVDIELILVTVLLKDYNNLRLFFFTGGIIFGTTLSLALVFIPKMKDLYQDPQGKNIFSDATHHSTQGTERIMTQIDKSRVIHLEKEVQTLQNQLKRAQSTQDLGVIQDNKTSNGVENSVL